MGAEPEVVAGKALVRAYVPNAVPPSSPSSNTSKRVDVVVADWQQAQAVGLLPKQTRSTDFWIRPKGELEEVVASTVVSALAFTPAERRQLDMAAELDCLGRLLADLLTAENVWVSYSRKNEWYAKWTGYLPPSINRKRVVRLVDKLRDAGMVEHCQGYRDPAAPGYGFQSSMRALPALLSLFSSSQQAATEADPNAPVVIVKDEKGNPCTTTNPNDLATAVEKVRKLREWMRTFVIETPAQPGRQELRQMFSSAALDKHGRLYGWWQNLSQADRQAIRLDGEEVVELDFVQNHPSILYNQLGLPVPDNAYSVPNLPEYMTSDEQRGLAKETFGRMLNGTDERGLRWKLGQELRSSSLANHIIDTLLQIHAPLVAAGRFWKGIGNELMRKDAEIAVKVMTWAMWKRIPMLPIHDSFVIPRRHEANIRQQMEQAYHAYLATTPGIKAKTA